MKKKDIKGQRFQRLTVIEEDITHQSTSAYWRCICDCGILSIVRGASLRNGTVRSCGCLMRDVNSARRKHGLCNTKEYRAYINAKSRCENPDATHYKNYGGRGIAFRFSSFEEFYKELGNRPSAKHSVERIDVNGNYEPGNVMWADKSRQMRNKRGYGSSCYQGVSWQKRIKRWRAYVVPVGSRRQLHLGYFANELEAAGCVVKAKIQLGIIPTNSTPERSNQMR
jgi:hypothetical protein